MGGNLLQIFQPSGVGQAVEIDELRNSRVVDDMVNQVGADKTRAAGD